MLVNLILPFLVAATTPQQIALPTPEQRRWQDLGIGVFFHFAPNTYTNKEYDNLSLPLSHFNPTKLNTDQWADAAAALGAKYVILVAKHAGGFCLWPTKTTDYSIANTPFEGGKGDIVRDLAASCRKRHLLFGIYLSPTDAYHHAGGAGRTQNPADQQAYDKVYREQLTELLTHYGDIMEIWFDGSQSVNVTDILHKYAPHAMIFQGPDATIRWVGNEDGFAPYPAWDTLSKTDAKTGIATSLHGDPDGDAWMPLEVDVSLHRPDWFWHTNYRSHILSLNALMSIYYRSVGRGCNLLLNIPPDTDGLVSVEDFQRAKEFGDEIRKRFGHAIAETRGSGNEITLDLGEPTEIDTVELQEDISHGERVRNHVVEAWVDGDWKQIESGSMIGERRLAPFDPITTTKLRLRVLQSVGEPMIRRFAVFYTGVEPPRDWNAQSGVWASDAAGSWETTGDFSFDLTSKLQAATTYRIRFVGVGGAGVTVSDLTYTQDGVAQPGLIRPEDGRSDVFRLTITGLPQKGILAGRIDGADRGTVLVQRIG